MDARKGFILLDIQFGPNFMDGDYFEDDIKSYAVFMTDAATGERLFDTPVTEVARQERLPPVTACCKDTTYTVRIDAALPENATEVAFEIVPITSVGPLPVGSFTGTVLDASFSTASALSRRSCTSLSVFSGVPLVLALALSFRLGRGDIS